MFKVIDKRDNNIKEIYAVSNDTSNSPKFLYYDETSKKWKWYFTDWFEPYIENVSQKN